MRIFVLVAVTIAGFSLLAVPLVTQTLPVESDLGRYHLPLRHFYQQCLLSGDDPGWCPHLFCGYDCHGEGQVGMDHPWHRLLYQFLPLTTAFNLEIFASYPFLFAGMVLFLRRHGLSKEAVLAGAIAATFSGYTLPHWPHTNAIAVIAHIPWLLWLIDLLFNAVDTRSRVLPAIGIALATGSQLLLGYPQYVYFSGLAEAGYVGVLFITRRNVAPVYWSVGKLTGIAVGFAQFWPSMEAARLSSRPAYDPQFQAMLSLPPAMLLQLVAPTRFNEFMQLHEYTVYGGMLATLATVWFLSQRKLSLPASTLGRWSLVILVVAVPLALGRFTPLWRVYTRLPILGLFRCPSRYLVLSHLAAAVVVALFVDDLTKNNSRPNRRWLLLVLPIAAWTMAGSWWDTWVSAESRPFLTSRGAWGAISLSVGTVLLLSERRCSVVAVPLLLLAGFADLGYWGFRSIAVYKFLPLSELIAQEPAPPGEPNGRLVTSDVVGDTLMLRGWSYTSGYVGLTPPRALDYSKPEVQRLAGTTWRHDGLNWQPVDGAPRLRLAAMRGSIALTTDRPGRVAVNIDTPADDTLIFTESWHPGWRAVLDGEPVPLKRYESDFLQIAVPAGRHVVEFRFDSVRRTQGRWVSAAALLLCILLGVWYTRHPRLE
ncbi:MAG: hypothetical protein K1X57_06625 [Gemmataceae bacterium]|nr:hypothetical protein [Gemmataceae bacterium]